MQTKFLREVLQGRDGVHSSEEGLPGSQHNTELTEGSDKCLSIIIQKILFGPNNTTSLIEPDINLHFNLQLLKS